VRATVLCVLLALGCGGQDGAPGPQGEPGEIGPRGDPGPMGPMGASGMGLACWDDDENGACDVATEDADGDGVCTAADCGGPQGPSGIVDTLGFDAYVNNTRITGVPAHCATTSYTAGPNEVAVLSFQATATGRPADGGNLLLANIAVSTDGGTTYPVAMRGRQHIVVYASSALAGIAHVSTSQRVELVEGTEYIFGLMVGGGTTMAGLTCTGTVTITRAS